MSSQEIPYLFSAQGPAQQGAMLNSISCLAKNSDGNKKKARLWHGRQRKRNTTFLNTVILLELAATYRHIELAPAHQLVHFQTRKPCTFPL